MRKAIACHAPVSCSEGRQLTRPKRTVPGPITTIRERNSSACPGGDTRAETVERPPPPCVGTQPSSGWKAAVRLRDRDRAEERVARRRRARAATGAPSRPTKSTRTSREVTCASSPPTMLLPFGHVSRYSVVPCAGTTTHGPATRMHDWMPWHSFVAAPAGANAAATASDATIAVSSDPHGNLRNQRPERQPAGEHEHDAAAGGRGGHLDGLVRFPDARAELGVRALHIDARRAPVEPSPAPARDLLQHRRRGTGTWMRSVKPPFSGCTTTPSGVPSETAETGIPAFFAAAAACCGVTRPAVCPPSESSTIAAGGRGPGFVPFTERPTCTARRDRVGERRSLWARLRADDRRREQRVRSWVGATATRRVIRERDDRHAVAASAACRR